MVSLLELLAGARPGRHRVAFQESREITLAQLRADVLHNAKRLSGRPLRRGTVVCDDGYWFLVGVLTLVKLDADVLLPPNAQPGTLRNFIGEVDCMLGDSTDTGLPEKLVLESGHGPADPLELDVGKSKIYFFTSGSTGEMKRIEKSLVLFEREATVLESMWGNSLGETPVIGMVTHQHVFGMTFRIMWPLLAGRPFYSEFHVAWESLLSRINRPSMIVASPAQLTRLGGLAPEPQDKRPRMIITAGAPLPPAAAARTSEIFGCVPTEIFGSTEAGVIAWRRGPHDPGLWTPFPSVEIAVDAKGAMRLRSPHCSGEGWYEQADRISLNGDGRFRFEGRTDRILKIEGKRVSLDRLEREILALDLVEEAAVVRVGNDIPHLGAVVKLSPAGLAEFARLGKFRFERMLRRELSKTEDLSVLPRRWRFVDLMPMDGLGKRRMRDVVALLEQSL